MSACAHCDEDLDRLVDDRWIVHALDGRAFCNADCALEYQYRLEAEAEGMPSPAHPSGQGRRPEPEAGA